MAAVPRGYFVSFEGGEGAGKSTQIGRLARRLEERGADVVVTREPGGSPRAERIRQAVLDGAGRALGPFAEALMFSAARIDHLRTVIHPALARGAVVLSDRFADSTRVYQGALGNLDPALLERLEAVVVEGTRPDLTFVLDVPVEIGLRRAAQRRRARGEAADRFEAEAWGYHNALRLAFRQLAEDEPARCVLMDGEADPDAIERRIWTIVEERFPRELIGSGARDVA